GARERAVRRGAGRGNDGVGVVDARRLHGRAGARRVARLARFEHAVAAGRLAIVVVARIAAGRTAPVVVGARRLEAGIRAYDVARLRRPFGRLQLTADGRAARRAIPIAHLARFDDSIAAPGHAIDVGRRVATAGAARIVGDARGLHRAVHAARIARRR